jgi:rSAM/selenodomain-associated transferase 1
MSRAGPRACAFGIMTKAPRSGQVKTRLSPPLTLDQAAGFQVCFLKDTAESVASLCGAGHGAGIAVYTPEGAAPFIRELLPPHFGLLPQRGATLGERLLNAGADLLAAGYASVCLIDSDSPTVPPAVFARAAALLALPGPRVVLGPADDGGYYLVGVTACHPRLFDDIAWSTDRVLAQTIDRARELALPVELLPPWYDVDDGRSLRRLCGDLLSDGRAATPAAAQDPYGAPHTRDYLRRLVSEGREDLGPEPLPEGLRVS